MKINILIIALVVSFIQISCSSAYKSIDLYSLKLGMSKDQVLKTLKKPDNLIGAKEYPSGRIEVLQYSKYDAWYGQLQERYWLYFYNDILKQWGRPGDWQAEADKVYELRLR